MARWLEIREGVACNEWFGDVPPDGVFVNVSDRPSVSAGMHYDAEQDVFTAPVVTAVDYGRSLGVREFFRLFTPGEFSGVMAAASSDPDVRYWLTLAQIPEPIRLKHPDTLAGLALLVGKGLLSSERRATILAS
jgi:hypothetical protein